MSKKIGIENFRVFKEYTEFEIRPITLLTGPNNSGKSSFTKLLLLLQNGIQNLNFERGNHNLESFSKILNWDNTSETLNLELNNTIPIFNESFRICFEISKATLSKITIKSLDEVILEICFTEAHMIEYGSAGFVQKVNFNIEYLIEIIYKMEFLVSYSSTKDDNFNNNNLKKLNEIELPFEPKKNHLLPELDNDLKDYSKFWHQSKVTDIRNYALINSIAKLKKDFLIFEIELNGKKPSKSQSEKIRQLQQEIFSELTFCINLGMSFGFKDFEKNYHYLLDNIKNKAKSKLLKALEEEFNIDNIRIEDSDLGNLIFQAKIFKDSFEVMQDDPIKAISEDLENTENYYAETLFDQFKNLKFNLKEYLGDFHYISANRGNQKRVLMNSSENEIDEIVLEYSKLSLTSQNLPFLKQAFKIFDIEGELEVTRYENFISVITINQNNHKITLADLGYGYSQIIPIILKIILVGNSNNENNNLIIEEPEANLHPNLQSKFVDLLSICLEEFQSMNFIIETHSEYLIRKLQYLTASGDIYSSESIIYYFNSDKYVGKEEPKVKKIEINKSGNLSDTFGPGFYDEATRLQFDLLKLNREQNN